MVAASAPYGKRHPDRSFPAATILNQIKADSGIPQTETALTQQEPEIKRNFAGCGGNIHAYELVLRSFMVWVSCELARRSSARPAGLLETIQRTSATTRASFR
jgi:hypothetical protein